MRPFLKSSQLLAFAAWKADFSDAVTLSAQNHHDRRWLAKSEMRRKEKTQTIAVIVYFSHFFCVKYITNDARRD